MEEKTAKIKVVNINDRYISKTIQFKIDIANRDILELNYIIAAVNDTFSSPSIKIDLGKENVCGFMLYHLLMMKTYMEYIHLGLFGNLHIQCEGILDNVSSIIFEETDKVDDLGRCLMEFSYITEDINTIDIPLEIMPTFLDTFIQIITDRDIIEEEDDENIDKVDGTTTEEDENGSDNINNTDQR